MRHFVLSVAVRVGGFPCTKGAVGVESFKYMACWPGERTEPHRSVWSRISHSANWLRHRKCRCSCLNTYIHMCGGGSLADVLTSMGSCAAPLGGPNKSFWRASLSPSLLPLSPSFFAPFSPAARTNTSLSLGHFSSHRRSPRALFPPPRRSSPSPLSSCSLSLPLPLSLSSPPFPPPLSFFHALSL